MKKFIIILISIFSLLSSFAFGFFIKKFVDDKKLYNLEIEKNNLEEKINNFKEINSDSCEIEREKLKGKINQLEKINLKLSKYTNYRNSDNENNLEKLTDDIYFDKNSLTIKKYSISGWFKMYTSKDRYTHNTEDNSEYYILIKYDADCKEPALCLEHIKEFDKDGNLLSDEPNKYGVCYNGAGGWINGEIAYEALCRYKKNGK